MSDRRKREMAAAFEKLGHLFLAGVPFLQAVRVAADECRDRAVANALREIHRRVSIRQRVDDVLSEFGDTFPVSVQLLWKVGQKRDLEQCCLRIASILRAETSGQP